MFLEFLKKYFIHSRIFISICAVAMTLETYLLQGVFVFNFYILCFIFFSTLFSYNLYYIRYPNIFFNYHKELAIVAFIASAYLFSMYLTAHSELLLLISIFSSLYIFSSFLKKNIFKTPLIKIFLLTTVWTLTIVLLPIIALPIHEEINSTTTIFIFCHHFVFMFILNLVFDIKDRNVDKNLNRMTIASHNSEKTVFQILYISVLILISIQLAAIYFLENKYIPLALLFSTAILFYFIKKSIQHKNLTWYLIFIDGMMLIPFLATLFILYFKY